MPQPLPDAEANGKGTRQMTERGLRKGLQAFIRASGHPGEIVGDVDAIPEGHAGLAHSFSVSMPGGERRDYVLKVGPAGVRRSGSTDVYRQAPLLRALKAQGLPVPDIIWASDSDDWLGAPFIVMERLPGKSLIVWEPDIRGDLSGYWLESARMLAQLHRQVDLDRLAGWEKPTGLAEEVERWSRLIRHTMDEYDRQAATRLGAALLQDVPDTENDQVLVHGDFQPGNILYVDGKGVALIDWDLAGIGPRGIDLGWLLVMGDRAAWANDWQPACDLQPAALIRAYEEAGGTAPEDIDWYRALACFRMGVITGMNVKLHREGRRPDPIWDRFASSAATLLRRGSDLLDNERISA